MPRLGGGREKRRPERPGSARRERHVPPPPPPVYELAWIALGAAACGIGVRLRRYARLRRKTAQRQLAARTPRPTSLRPTEAQYVRRIASLADELASLISGLEGRAHHLIEAAPHRAQVPAAAEGLLHAIERLRTLHKKLQTVGRGGAVARGTTALGEVVAALRDEWQQMQLGLEVRFEPPADLPPVGVHVGVAVDALLFLSAAMLRAERGASRLSIAVERCFAGEQPRLQIELLLEWITDGGDVDGGSDVLSDSSFALDLEAANHLVTRSDGELVLSHLPGRSVRAVVRWPIAADAEPSDAEAPVLVGAASADAGPEFGHQFGGALVLESDPALRAVLARELKASGRAVFACADGASARTFLEATPDRFELLVVDDPARLDEKAPLTQTIRTRTPNLKIFVLSPTPDDGLQRFAQLHCLQKPFGMHELRRALASVLATG